MAEARKFHPDWKPVDSGSRIQRFEVNGLFGRDLNYTINFPEEAPSRGEPRFLIIAGPNGSGKTTILQMIEGLLGLDFDVFRRLPFTDAKLVLSGGQELRVKRQQNVEFPLLAEFGQAQAELARTKPTVYPPELEIRRTQLRAAALPILNTLHYQLLDIHRSSALRIQQQDEQYILAANGEVVRHPASPDSRPRNLLAQRVRNFVRDAQVNYRRFFAEGQLELLPRILQRLGNLHGISKNELINRLANIRERSPNLLRMGLETDDADIESLSNLLTTYPEDANQASLAVFEAYVEMLESRDKTRALIAQRLVNFEEIMADFLVGKDVRIDANEGLRIRSDSIELKESELSSGEYHFLYMMVSALLCLRTGTIIAIDEPELSLHVTWQRGLVGALTRCAAGASPLFLFATHSAAISAEHSDCVQYLSAEQ